MFLEVAQTAFTKFHEDVVQHFVGQRVFGSGCVGKAENVFDVDNVRMFEAENKKLLMQKY